VQDRLIPREAPFINADLHEASELQHVLDAQKRSSQAQLWPDARRTQCLQEGRSFASETVFSHSSKLVVMAAAQWAGFSVVLLVVCVDDPQQLLERVAQRVSEGGHATAAHPGALPALLAPPEPGRAAARLGALRAQTRSPVTQISRRNPAAARWCS
jgi:hypothetical protein